MYKIIKIEPLPDGGGTISLGDENQNFITVPLSSANYDNPQVGDCVNLFQGDGYTIVSKIQNEEKHESKKPKRNQSTGEKKPIYKRPWCIILMVVLVLGGIGSILDMLDPKVESISAVYNGKTIGGTKVTIDDFTVTAKYDDGSTDEVTSASLEEDLTLAYGKTYKAVINYDDAKTTVEIKCDTRSEEEKFEAAESIIKTAYDLSMSEIGAEYKITRDGSTFIINITKDGIANALVLAKEYDDESCKQAWKQLRKGLNSGTSKMLQTLKEQDIKNPHVILNLLNDQNKDNVLFTSYDGSTYYDALE